mmetsp:Transcript_47003/g.134483  ORF Transcript_47003/g.134483 Transcript_47003/m.134483 type:complete len:223 (-) Transcript_47003:426-1094(-)
MSRMPNSLFCFPVPVVVYHAAFLPCALSKCVAIFPMPFAAIIATNGLPPWSDQLSPAQPAATLHGSPHPPAAHAPAPAPAQAPAPQSAAAPLPKPQSPAPFIPAFPQAPDQSPPAQASPDPHEGPSHHPPPHQPPPMPAPLTPLPPSHCCCAITAEASQPPPVPPLPIAAAAPQISPPPQPPPAPPFMPAMLPAPLLHEDPPLDRANSKKRIRALTSWRLGS